MHVYVCSINYLYVYVCLINYLCVYVSLINYSYFYVCLINYLLVCACLINYLYIYVCLINYLCAYIPFAVCTAIMAYNRRLSVYWALGRNSKIREMQLRVPLKPLIHYGNFVPKGVKGAFNWAPLCREAPVFRAADVIFHQSEFL